MTGGKKLLIPNITNTATIITDNDLGTAAYKDESYFAVSGHNHDDKYTTIQVGTNITNADETNVKSTVKIYTDTSGNLHIDWE